jgi:hypothetical protein
MSDLQKMFDECHTAKFQKITDETRAKMASSKGRIMSEETRAKMSAIAKGRKKTKQHRQRIGDSNTIRIFKGKNVDEWSKILGGDKGEIRKHIKNNTMETYGPYRKYIGLTPLPRNQWAIKHIMTPKGIMTYKQAKEAFGWSQKETVRNRVCSDNYPDWYEVCVK